MPVSRSSASTSRCSKFEDDVKREARRDMGSVPAEPFDCFRKHLASLVALLALGIVFGCTMETPEEGASGDDPTAATGSPAVVYDSARATALGADEYGMRTYVVALLKAGPNRDLDSLTASEMQRAHLDNVFRLADEGALLLQGPFLDDGSLRGFYVFDATKLEEARRLTETDPAIRQGWLEMELRPWYGSAALQEVYDIHRRIRRLNP